jgi:hypothetical protein
VSDLQAAAWFLLASDGIRVCLTIGILWRNQDRPLSSPSNACSVAWLHRI